jgi:hypothetical protein
MIICGAAAAVASGLEAGLRETVLDLIRERRGGRLSGADEPEEEPPPDPSA